MQQAREFHSSELAAMADYDAIMNRMHNGALILRDSVRRYLWWMHLLQRLRDFKWFFAMMFFSLSVQYALEAVWPHPENYWILSLVLLAIGVGILVVLTLLHHLVFRMGTDPAKVFVVPEEQMAMAREIGHWLVPHLAPYLIRSAELQVEGSQPGEVDLQSAIGALFEFKTDAVRCESRSAPPPQQHDTDVLHRITLTDSLLDEPLKVPLNRHPTIASVQMHSRASAQLSNKHTQPFKLRSGLVQFNPHAADATRARH